MSSIGNVNNSLLQSQLSGIQLREEISYRVAAKTLDAARDQGDMVLTLLDKAADVARNTNQQNQIPTLGAVVSGLGQSLDIRG